MCNVNFKLNQVWEMNEAANQRADPPVKESIGIFSDLENFRH